MFCKSPKQLSEKLQSVDKSQSVVFTNGCFDLLHMGHILYLEEAKTLGDILVVGLNTDDSVQRLKGPKRPIQKEQDRAQILQALGCVDYTVLFKEDTPLKLIELIEPDILVKGGDWAVDEIVGSPFVLSQGGQVHSLSLSPGRSTSQIIDRIVGKEFSR